MRMKEIAIGNRSYIFMGSAVLLLMLTLFFGPAVGSSDTKSDAEVMLTSTGTHVAGSFLNNSQRIRFTENRGQIVDTDGNLRPDILYTADADGVRLYFTSQGVSYVFTRVEDEKQQISEATGMSPDDYRFDQPETSRNIIAYRMDMELVGSNSDVRIRAERELYGYDNFYYAHCPDGITYVKSYGKIIYENVYDNIDMVWTASTDKTKYEFIVHPGGRVNDIRMRYDGSEGITTSNTGIEIQSPLGGIREHGLVSWQDGRDRIPTSFTVCDNEIGFDVGSYNPARSFVIDPWATFYGGSGLDEGSGIDVDASGNVVITGATRSSNFPVQNAQQSTFAGDQDAILLKFNASGLLQWATYYGGSGYDHGFSVALMSNGNPVVTGWTTSTNFPLQNPQQGTHGGGDDAILMRFSSSGVRQWASFFGGSGGERGHDIVIDGSSNIIISGNTGSTNLPVLNATQASNAGGGDTFLAKFNGTGSTQWATYFGGDQADGSRGVAVDANGNVYLGGDTRSGNFPVLNPFQATRSGVSDAFIACFNSTGTPQWATYYGGSDKEQQLEITCDGSGNVVLVGATTSMDFPVLSAVQSNLAGNWDAIALCFSSTGTRQWATYLGGSDLDKAQCTDTDGSGNIVISGYTRSTNFPTLNPYQGTNLGGEDVFVMKLTSSGALQWSSYYGGLYNDEGGYGVAIDGSGGVYVTGKTRSPGFPTHNAWQSTHGGGSAGPQEWDAFILALASDGAVPVELVSFTASVVDNDVLLAWRTSTEVSNHGFEIERNISTDAPWKTIGFMPGSGDTYSSQEYRFNDLIDRSVVQNTTFYYRLKQIDFDGTFEYSPIVSVQLGSVPQSVALLEPYPNPALDYLFIPFTVPDERPVTIRLFNIAGQEVLSVYESEQIGNGSHSVMANTSGLPSGTYIIELAAGLKKQTRRIIIAR